MLNVDLTAAEAKLVLAGLESVAGKDPVGVALLERLVAANEAAYGEKPVRLSAAEMEESVVEEEEEVFDFEDEDE